MDPVVETLSVDECRRRLAEGGTGQLAMTVNALPVVQPVFFVLRDDFVVIRTPEQSSLCRAVSGAVVAFGTYGFDELRQEAWNVMVQGTGQRVTKPELAEPLRALPLRSWGDRPGPDCFVRVPLERLSGTRAH